METITNTDLAICAGAIILLIAAFVALAAFFIKAARGG